MNEIATGIPALSAARAIPIASSGYVSVSPEIMSAPASASVSTCAEWYRSASFGGHQRSRPVGVVAGADGAADDHRGRRMVGANLLDQPDRLPVGVREPLGVVVEPVAPIGVRTPRRGVEDEADAALAREHRVRLEVRAQLAGPGVALEQRERSEAGQVDPALERQDRLHAAVGDARLARVWGSACRYPMPPERYLTRQQASLGQQG